MKLKELKMSIKWTDNHLESPRNWNSSVKLEDMQK